MPLNKRLDGRLLNFLSFFFLEKTVFCLLWKKTGVETGIFFNCVWEGSCNKKILTDTFLGWVEKMLAKMSFPPFFAFKDICKIHCVSSCLVELSFPTI